MKPRTNELKQDPITLRQLKIFKKIFIESSGLKKKTVMLTIKNPGRQIIGIKESGIKEV